MRRLHPTPTFVAPLAAILLAACGESPVPDSEMERHAAWIKKLKAEHPEEGREIAEACIAEVGVGISKKAVYELTLCMRRKADEVGLG